MRSHLRYNHRTTSNNLNDKRYNRDMQDLSELIYKQVGIQLSATQIASLIEYEKALLSWNKQVNLTAIRDPKMIRIKHFLDSLTCLSVMKNTSMDRVIDVGTGAGFPGLPLKIVCPEIKLTLVESIRKKAEFCEFLVSHLKLKGVEIAVARVEDLGNNQRFREKYDWATARAVAILPTIAEYLLPLVKIGGAMLAMKGENAPIEAHQAENAIRILGGHLRRLHLIHLPEVSDDRYLVVVEKIAATPKQYPRRIGIPAKNPL